MIKLYIRMFKLINDEEREALSPEKEQKGQKKARYAQGRNGAQENGASRGRVPARVMAHVPEILIQN